MRIHEERAGADVTDMNLASILTLVAELTLVLYHNDKHDVFRMRELMVPR